MSPDVYGESDEAIGEKAAFIFTLHTDIIIWDHSSKSYFDQLSKWDFAARGGRGASTTDRDD